MKKTLITLIFSMATLLITACGGGSSGTTTNSKNSIKIKTLKSFIDSDQKNFYLEFSMINQYQDGIVAELSDINVDLNSCTPSSYKLNTDGEILKYDKPSESYTVKVIAKFPSSCIPTGYRVDANSYLTFDNTSNKSSFHSGLIPIAPIEDAIFEDKESLFEYEVLLVAQNGSSKIKLNSEKRYKLSLGVKDENRTVVNTNSDFQEERVNHITIRSNDPSKIQLILPKNYHTDHEMWQKELNFDNLNDVDLFIKTFNTSGVVNLDVIIEYTNNQGEKHKIETTTSLTVLSGEPTAFSINSAGVSYNEETKWFENKFMISASDKYNNPINIPSKINVTAMADFRDNYGEGKRILHGSFNPIKNTLSQYEEGKALFRVAQSNIFRDIDIERDYLLLFGDITTNEALGKWDIEDSSGDSLFLRDIYHGNKHENLGFAVGHNYLKDPCSNESKEWELKIDSLDQNYQLDEEGKTYVMLKFPPYLIGKTVALSVNFSGENGRTGEVSFHTLHSFQGVKPPEDITIDANETALAPIHFYHELAVDTGTDDYWWIKNSGVSCTIETENIMGFGAVDTISSQNRPISDISQCSQDNIAFFNFNIKLKDEEKSGSISFKKCQTFSFNYEF
jgi:hypothetical protein